MNGWFISVCTHRSYLLLYIMLHIAGSCSQGCDADDCSCDAECSPYCCPDYSRNCVPIEGKLLPWNKIIKSHKKYEFV